MGFFDKILGGSSAAVAKPTINNENEAFLTIIAASASADGDIEGEEWDTIYDTLFQKKMFGGADLSALLDETKSNIKAYPSLSEAVTECAAHIKADNKNMLFTICTDIILIDGSITPNEQSILEHLKNTLAVTDDFAMKTIEVMLVRNYGNL
jgi:uncharacterized tellurite resistance protein B-like protein